MTTDTIGQAFCNGIEDRHAYGLLRKEQLYRSDLGQRIAWRLGWELANILTPRPLRTAKRAAPSEGDAGPTRPT